MREWTQESRSQPLSGSADIYLSILLSSRLDALEQVWLGFMHTLDPEARHDAFLDIGSKHPLVRTKSDQHDMVKHLIVEVESTLYRHHRQFVKAPHRMETNPTQLETMEDFHSRCDSHAREREALATRHPHSLQNGLEQVYNLRVHPAIEFTPVLHAVKTIEEMSQADPVKFREKHHQVLKMFGHFLDHAKQETNFLHSELEFNASPKNRLDLDYGAPGDSRRLDHQKWFTDLMIKCDRSLDQCQQLEADYNRLSAMKVQRPGVGMGGRR